MSKTVRALTWCSASLVLLAVVVFRNDWNLSAWSVVPLFLALLSVFLVYCFRREGEHFEQTAYGSALTEREQCILFRYLSSVIAVLAPWQGVFVFFFKVGKLMSVAVFLIGFLLAPMLFRVRFGKQIRARREREQSELEEQRKKEERGLWK